MHCIWGCKGITIFFTYKSISIKKTKLFSHFFPALENFHFQGVCKKYLEK